MSGDLPECCAGEGYPGIAHDLLTARRERDEARDALLQIAYFPFDVMRHAHQDLRDVKAIALRAVRRWK